MRFTYLATQLTVISCKCDIVMHVGNLSMSLDYDCIADRKNGKQYKIVIFKLSFAAKDGA